MPGLHLESAPIEPDANETGFVRSLGGLEILIGSLPSPEGIAA
jgi:hypothetical protein